jgi:hypothetical protein
VRVGKAQGEVAVEAASHESPDYPVRAMNLTRSAAFWATGNPDVLEAEQLEIARKFLSTP